MYKENVLKHARFLRNIAEPIAALGGFGGIVLAAMGFNAGSYDFAMLIYGFVCFITAVLSYFVLQVLADISTSLVLTDEEKLKEEPEQ